jgi:hypothetical protein
MRNRRSWCDYRIRLVVRYVIDAPTTTALLSFPLFRELEAYHCKGYHVPAVRHRDAFYQKLEDDRAAALGQN